MLKGAWRISFTHGNCVILVPQSNVFGQEDSQVIETTCPKKAYELSRNGQREQLRSEALPLAGSAKTVVTEPTPESVEHDIAA
jgi:hypothetical protein